MNEETGVALEGRGPFLSESLKTDFFLDRRLGRRLWRVLPGDLDTDNKESQRCSWHYA